MTSPHLNEAYLPLLSEECGEIVQAVGKIQRFGVDHPWHSQGGMNYEVLAWEIGGLLEVIDRLKLPPELIKEGIRMKVDRLKKWGPEVWVREP